MKAFLAAIVVVAGISFAASVLLETFQRTADAAFTGPGVRIDVEHHGKSGAPKG